MIIQIIIPCIGNDLFKCGISSSAGLFTSEIVYLLEIAFLRLCLHSEIAYFTSDYSDCLGRDVVPVDGIEVKEEKKNDNTLFNVEVVKEPIPSEWAIFRKVVTSVVKSGPIVMGSGSSSNRTSPPLIYRLSFYIAKAVPSA